MDYSNRISPEIDRHMDALREVLPCKIRTSAWHSFDQARRNLLGAGAGVINHFASGVEPNVEFVEMWRVHGKVAIIQLSAQNHDFELFLPVRARSNGRLIRLDELAEFVSEAAVKIASQK